MVLMASGQLEKSQSKDFFKLLREVLRYQEWSGPSGLHKPAACAGLQPLGPQGLKPHRHTAFDAGLKRCSTQNQAPPKSKSTQYQRRLATHLNSNTRGNMPTELAAAAAGVKNAAATPEA